MASKTDFTSEEWSTLRDALQVAALAVAVSGASGLVGTLKEAFASSVALVEGTRSESELVRSLCTREEISAGQQALRENLPQTRRIDDAKQALSALAVEKARAAMEILRRKGDPADAEAYRGFVKNVGERVAQSAKEGGVLGFGGKRVSEGEQQMLASLDGALGGGGATA
ncbi:MAG TPA: hypothetical protein VLC53_00210 [Myxococcota bacterium]|nr:hypothetical protein [Myxococcota bacterium]